MPVATVQVNSVLLNKRCECYFEGMNVFAPVRHGSVEVAAEAIAELGADSITVKARVSSNPKHVAADQRTFAKRLKKLAEACGYTATEFSLSGCILTAKMEKNIAA